MSRFTTADGTVVTEGDVISVDGTAGTVYLGELPVAPSPVADYFEGRRAGSAPPGSACAAPSTCFSATAGCSSSG